MLVARQQLQPQMQPQNRDPPARAGPWCGFIPAGGSIVSELRVVLIPVFFVNALAGACLGCGFSSAGWSIVSELLSLLGPPFLHGGWMDSLVLIYPLLLVP